MEILRRVLGLAQIQIGGAAFDIGELLVLAGQFSRIDRAGEKLRRMGVIAGFQGIEARIAVFFRTSQGGSGKGRGQKHRAKNFGGTGSRPFEAPQSKAPRRGQ